MDLVMPWWYRIGKFSAARTISGELGLVGALRLGYNWWYRKLKVVNIRPYYPGLGWVDNIETMLEQTGGQVDRALEMC